MKKNKYGVFYYRLRGQKNNYSKSINASKNWDKVLKIVEYEQKRGHWDKIIIEQTKIIKVLRLNKNNEKIKD
ncbi:hypothetical protein [Mycoplasma miroungirhinis]|uniref:Uncharacterized protein n=1 Tax=Mycoplasma miroungirhinis TaxID=754516 RepID=A0A6M4JAB9_9MOLU|nr:hypothetical protein [Mycoplasma miroungirhinis]QJR43944.1 hypothetical protein HLA92_00580 [Mycoplasma miroungirhinis]